MDRISHVDGNHDRSCRKVSRPSVNEVPATTAGEVTGMPVGGRDAEAVDDDVDC